MTFIWIAVILLGLMAVADLIVGVSNDAVNFLNAAIGSKSCSNEEWCIGLRQQVL